MRPAVHGFAAPGFGGVLEAFASSFEGNPKMGASIAVRHRGAPVVDLWGGFADSESGRPWQEDTVSVIFSCTKGLTAILAARLVQEGLLDYDAPVSSYWPEFGAAGKAWVPVRDLLAHRAGLSAPRLPLSSNDLSNWDIVVSQLAAQRPLWEPGAGYAYHPITYGWLVGEVIRRIAGQSLGQYFAEQIAEPLNAEAWIGLPAEQFERVAIMHAGATLTDHLLRQASAHAPGTVDWVEQGATLGGALPPGLVGPGSGFNSPALWSAEIPAAGGIASARALAAIWSATFVATDGVRLMDDATIAKATVLQSEGAPVFDVPTPWPRFGMGFLLDSDWRRYVTPTGFGHEGAGGQVSFADPEVGVGFAFLTNQMEAEFDERGTRIVDALRSALS